MSRLGLYNTFPVRLGGGESDHQIEHQNLLRQLSAGFSNSSESPTFWETYGEALALAIMWATNRRLAGQGIPAKMLENLPVWEEATRTIPQEGQSELSRRNALAAKLAILISNNITQIEVSASRILGENYHSVVVFDPATHITYWPGINPGPPGYEWSSSKAHIAVAYKSSGISDSNLKGKLDSLSEDLEQKLPAWMTVTIGAIPKNAISGYEFIINQGVIGTTLL